MAEHSRVLSTSLHRFSCSLYACLSLSIHVSTLGSIARAGHHVELAKSVLPALFARAGLAPVTPVGELDTAKMFAASPLPPRAGASAAEQQNPSSLPALAKRFGAGECKQRAENDALVNVEVLRRGGCAFFLERAFPHLFPGGASGANASAGGNSASASVPSSTAALSATAPAFKSLAAPKSTGSSSASSSSSILGAMSATSPAPAPVAATAAAIPPINIAVPASAPAPAPAASASSKPVSAASLVAASSSAKPPMSPTKQKPAPAKPASSTSASAPASAPASAAAATTAAASKPAAAPSVAPASPSFTGKARAPPSPLLAKHLPTTEWGLMDDEDDKFSLSPSGVAAFAASVAPSSSSSSSSAASASNEDAGWETVGAKKETGKKSQPPPQSQQNKQRPASAAARPSKPASAGAAASGGSGSGGKKEALASPEYIAIIGEAIRTGAPIKFSYQSDNSPPIDFKPRTIKALRWEPEPFVFVGVVVLPANASAATVAAKGDKKIHFSAHRLVNLKTA